MNPFRDLPHPAQRLKPVKEMLLQKLMDFDRCHRAVHHSSEDAGPSRDMRTGPPEEAVHPLDCSFFHLLLSGRCTSSRTPPTDQGGVWNPGEGLLESRVSCGSAVREGGRKTLDEVGSAFDPE
jgi:hypothetical protein